MFGLLALATVAVTPASGNQSREVALAAMREVMVCHSQAANRLLPSRKAANAIALAAINACPIQQRKFESALAKDVARTDRVNARRNMTRVLADTHERERVRLIQQVVEARKAIY